MTPLLWFAVVLFVVALAGSALYGNEEGQGSWLAGVAIIAVGVQCVIWTVKP